RGPNSARPSTNHGGSAAVSTSDVQYHRLTARAVATSGAIAVVVVHHGVRPSTTAPSGTDGAPPRHGGSTIVTAACGCGPSHRPALAMVAAGARPNPPAD